MVTRAALVLALLASCAEDDFRCDDDLDCDLGADGACEVDDRCTIRSATCDTGREYAPLQGALSGTCYDERRDPLNPCAEGQPPARGDSSACMAAICEAMPACCRSGWTSACVQQAQLRCTAPGEEVVCDTRIAITAIRASVPELWTATYHPHRAWIHTRDIDDATSLSWFAPRRGETEPRLGAITQGSVDPPVNATLLIDDVFVTNLEARPYYQAQSIDLARDAHDVLLLGSFAASEGYYETLDLDTMAKHEFTGGLTVRTVVGEVNRDGFPDIASCNNNIAGYGVALNEEPAAGTDYRRIGPTTGDAFNTGATMTMNIEHRSVEFSDVDDNRALDLLVAGRQVRAHMPMTEADSLNASRDSIPIDCMPPRLVGATCGGVDAAFVSWVATARPGLDRTTVVMAPWVERATPRPEDRIIYELEVSQAGIDNMTFVPMAGCGPVCDKKWVAIASRDLDGDHVMDLIAVDENINIYTSRSSMGGALELTLMITQPRESITNVRLTVTGAPIVNP